MAFIPRMVPFRFIHILFVILTFSVSCRAGSHTQLSQEIPPVHEDTSTIITGAEQSELYLPKLAGKRVAVMANPTSMVGDQHLVDFLVSRKINVVKVFAPEHGFRGEAGPGDRVKNGIDPRSGLPVISLYGSKKKPGKEDLEGIDWLLFDIQDVGARFYTFISSLHYLMEACADYNVSLMVLDRPNPNGFYIDGPVLEPEFSSFVGVDPIPLVHGLTEGEYAKMVQGEGWLRKGRECRLEVIPIKNYRHDKLYDLPVQPSPNLPDMESVYLYPTLCLFEGTPVSVGRGTKLPFRIAGFPGFAKGTFDFTPVEIEGVIRNPPYENVSCRGRDFRGESKQALAQKRLFIEWIIEMYEAYPDKEKFFTPFFDKLAGTSELRKQIQAGMSTEQIRQSWLPKLEEYRKMRLKYLLYP